MRRRGGSAPLARRGARGAGRRPRRLRMGLQCLFALPLHAAGTPCASADAPPRATAACSCACGRRPWRCGEAAEAFPLPARHARAQGDPQVPEEHGPAGPQAALRAPGAWRCTRRRCCRRSRDAALARNARARRAQQGFGRAHRSIPRCARTRTALRARMCAHLLLLCPLQVREIANNLTEEPFRWTAEALLALQEARAAASCAHACAHTLTCALLLRSRWKTSW